MEETRVKNTERMNYGQKRYVVYRGNAAYSAMQRRQSGLKSGGRGTGREI